MREEKLLVFRELYPANQRECDIVSLIKCDNRIDFSVEKFSGLRTWETRNPLPEELIKNGKVCVFELLSYIKENAIPTAVLHRDKTP